MIIKKDNVLNEFVKLKNLHDQSLNSIYFDYGKKSLSLILNDISSNDPMNIEFNNYSNDFQDYFAKYTILFSNCIYFACSSCDFWGKTGSIRDIKYVEAGEIDLLSNKARSYETKIENIEKYLEFVITLYSGDEIIIVCEKIMINLMMPK